LGVTPKDQARFHKWSKSLLALTAASSPLFGIPNMFALTRFLRGLFKERRAQPRRGLLSALLQAGETGGNTRADEMLPVVFILLIAGHETTVNLIGSGTLALLENPDQMTLLRNNPELIKNAVEEIVRFVNPVEEATERYPMEDVTLHGVTIPKGEIVLAILASANRDETVFEHPDKLDITRENNKHLGFGQGVHYCIGAPLARLEGQIAFSTLVKRLPHLKLGQAPSALRWRPGLTVRGLEALPVAL